MLAKHVTFVTTIDDLGQKRGMKGNARERGEMGVPRHWLDKRMQAKATLIELMLRVLGKTERLSAVVAVVRPLGHRNSSAVIVHS